MLPTDAYDTHEEGRSKGLSRDKWQGTHNVGSLGEVRDKRVNWDRWFGLEFKAEHLKVILRRERVSVLLLHIVLNLPEPWETKESYSP